MKKRKKPLRFCFRFILIAVCFAFVLLLGSIHHIIVVNDTQSFVFVKFFPSIKRGVFFSTPLFTAADIIWYWLFFFLWWFATINAFASLYASFNFLFCFAFVWWLWCVVVYPPRRYAKYRSQHTDFCGQALNVYRLYAKRLTSKAIFTSSIRYYSVSLSLSHTHSRSICFFPLLQILHCSA